MRTYEITAVVNDRGNLVIPAPVDKAGSRLRLVVIWEEETRSQTQDALSRSEAIEKLCGSLKDSPLMGVDEWNRHKHEIWQRP